MSLGRNRMKVETHCHTKEAPSGCGKLKAQELLSIYKEARYDGIILTNHIKQKYYKQGLINQFLEAFDIAKEEGDKIGLKVFFGVELNHYGTDYLIYGVDKEVVTQESFFNKRFDNIKEKCHNSGGIIIQAHPFREKRGKYMYRLNSNCDGYEIINGHPKNNQHNDLSSIYALARGDVITTAGSDCHFRSGACRAAIKFDSHIENEEQLVYCMKNRQYKLQQYF
jgi:predicted metal-dependent phosphoesterase TrpH